MTIHIKEETKYTQRATRGRRKEANTRVEGFVMRIGMAWRREVMPRVMWRSIIIMVLLSLPLLLGLSADGDRATGGRDMTGACFMHKKRKKIAYFAYSKRLFSAELS